MCQALCHSDLTLRNILNEGETVVFTLRLRKLNFGRGKVTSPNSHHPFWGDWDWHLGLSSPALFKMKHEDFLYLIMNTITKSTTISK